MKKNKNKDIIINQHHINQIEQDDNPDVVSSTESTGMLYKPPLTESDVKGYSDVYPVQQQKDMPSPTNQKKKNGLKNKT